MEGPYRRFRDGETDGDQKPAELVKAIEQCRKDFVSAMNDDFNTREAIASLFQLARIVNNYPSSSLTSDLSSELVKTFDYYGNQVLGLFTEHIIDDSLLASIKDLIAKRDAARTAKDWSQSDSIREELAEMGIEIQDTPEGTKWRRV